MNDQVLVSTPLSYGQKALWFQHQGNQEAPFNHLSFAARVVSGKDPDRLRQALNRLFQKYDSLHTRFFEREGELFQEVVHEVELPFEEIDATSLDEPTLLAKIAEVADEPYDLTSGVLMKAKLYHCANGEMVFFLGFHHISVDLWSMTGFIQELSQIFGNEAIGEEKREDRVNNYAEFVEYQSLIVHGDRGEELLNYWQSVLGQEIPILQLPEDATRPGIKTHRAATIRFELPMTLEASLRAFAKERGVTLYPVLLAAYMALLHKYSGQSDIVVGSPYAGRTRGKFRETFGFFVNMLVNRQLVTPKMSFVDLVTDVNQSAGKHLRKQDFPFPALVQKVTSQRDRSRSPLYDVEFVYDRPRMIEDIAPFIQGWNGAQLDLGELVFESIEFEKRWLERDLQLFISEGRDKLYGTLTYNRDLFFTTTAERFVSHFINLLTSAIREPENAIGSLDYLCQEERFLLLKQWNQTERAYPETGWVHDWLRTQAQETPQQTALHFSGKKLTYQELDDRIDRIAGILAARGVQTESPVAIVMYRSVEMVASLHAVMRTGGFYVPIDPELPQERIEWMVTEVNPNVILTQKSLLPLLEKLGVANKAIVLDDGDLPEAPAAAVPLAADNAAYMIYTSGSTSRPKGVVNTHGGIRNRILWMQEALQLSSKDRVLQKTPYSFDVSVWEFLWPFLVGAQLVVAKPEGHKDPDYLIDLIKEESITTIHFVPSMLQIFLANPRSRECASLRRVICSGEALPVTLAKEFFEAFPDCELHNLYGPTEAAVDVTWWKCEPSDSLRSVPIGYPIANTQMYILDEMLNPVPIGVTGDLYIGGCQLARGYWKRPDLTADRFIPDLFAEELGHRIYKTGDIARYLENGAIEYLGRSDFQVKIRGFRIELGEIEAQLQNHDSIKEAVVADRGEAGNKYLCAYIVADWELTVTELRDYLSKQLPGYMIPSFFVYLDQLPLSPNGKLDRKALPEPDKSVYTGVEYAAPTHEIEAKLVKIFQEVLEVEDIGIHHDFFELGGHSLKATILISKIHKELHVEVPLSEVFANPKIKELAHFVQNTEQNTHAAIQPIAEQAYYPTSSAQKRLYILGQLEGAGASYNMPGAMLVEGDLDKDRLEEAFRQLIQRHETLRTSFEMADEEIVQRVRPNVLFTIDVKEAVEEQAEAFITEFVQPFDLSQAPLLRVELIKLATDRHLLLFDMHHIISDGVSIGILIQEFVTLYQGNYLSPLRIQYKDFSAWQNERFASPALQADERYWLDTFAGEIPVLNMPTDFPRPSVQNFEGSSLTFELGRELTGKLHALAKATGSTLYMVLLAAYNTVLSKYTGQEDIVIGSPIAGRPHADLQSMIGMFVNTLAMRNFPVSELTFREFLKRVKENALKAYEHQNYPFEQLVEQLNIPRDMSRNPLFDTLFVLQNTDRGQLEVEGLSFTPYPFDSGMAKFDLTITVEEVEGRLACTLGYCTKLFKKETVERLAGHFTNILQQVADNAETKLAQLDMLSADERRQILEDFNNTAVSTQNCKTVIEQFEEQVEKTPDRPALLFENDVLTYREFNRQANQVAHYLRQKGVGENTVVGLMTQRSLEMMVGLYGILKAGAAYVPIDAEYPQERIRYLLDDSQITLVLTQRQLNVEVTHEGSEFTAIEDLLEQNEWSGDNLGLTYDPARIMYLLYTSGSTGKPKGVKVRANAFANLIDWFTSDQYEITDQDNILLIAPISFDLAQKNLYASLVKGGTLCLFTPGLYDYNRMFRIIKQQNITFVNCTPSAFQPLVDFDTKFESLKTLRCVYLGGEPLKPAFLTPWIRSGACNARIINSYGPAECTDVATSYQIDGREFEHLATVPVGKPIRNAKVYVLDKNRQPVPLGTLGEFYIGGVGVSAGYFNRPELTADRFVSVKVDGQEPQLLYRTGDVGKWLPDGNLEFLGRVDHQVKIRGFRIELSEIETQMLQHDNIKEAIVSAKGNEDDLYLCAYVVADRELPGAELKAYLSEYLPDYMVPPYYVQMDKLPLTPNGKVDRNALPEPDKAVQASVKYVAPTNEIEAKLLDIFQQVLNVQGIGTHHDFFELGGHSLKATILLFKIHKELEMQLPLSEVFKNTTVKELAKRIQQAELSIYEAIQQIEEKEFYPASSSQKRLYMLDQIQEVNTSYNMPGAMLVEGSLDPKRLEAAFQQLIRRHETLRTSFEMADEEIVQRVQSNVPFAVEVKEAEEKRAQALIAEFVQPFDLSQAPLLRVELIKLAADRHLLLFDMHHIISDGVSIGILIQEFVTLYQGNYLSPLRIQYKDFSAWQNERFASPALQADERYWLDTFAGEIPVLNMPTDFPRPSVQNFEGSSLTFELGRELTGKLHALAKATGSTLYMVLLAAYNTVLSKYTGQEDIVIGSPIAGRPHADLQSMIGMFVNTLAMRNFPVSELTFREFLKRVKENALKAYEHQNYPFEQLVEQLNIPRDMSRNPLFDTLFVLQNTDRGQLEVEGLSFTPYPFDSGMAKFDLTITVEEVEGRLACTLGYCTKLFKKETVERLAGHFTNILQQVADNAETKLAQLDMLSADERRQILEDFNNTAVSTQNCKTVIEQFEEQVEKTPDRPALLFENDVLTYREFNRQANQVAHYLRQKGVGENTVVGLMTQRSLEMMVGLYGILKAGAAYVPIDAEYPQERIRYLLDDSQITLVLTQRQLNVEVTHEGSEFTAIEDLLEQNEWSGDNLGLTYDPARIMYLLYTSGSTGKPKGVKVRANAFANLIDWFTSDQYEITDQDNILLIAPISFDLAQKNLYASLVKGGTLCLFTPGLYDYNRMFRIIKQQNITFVNCTPSAFQPLVDFDTKFESLKTLRCVYLGGEPLKPAFLTPWIRSGACNARIINSYGPAECTDVATSYQIDGREFEHLATVPVGKPIRNAKVYVLDKNRQPVPLGTLGEFYIGGVGVSAGYFNRPELTADRFVSVKVDGQEPQLLYRTGDVGKWLPDGNLEFLGRVDHQVKIRGFRIELSEIETQMLQHDNIKEAIVSAKGNEDDLYLCAYVVADRELPGAELKAYLSEYLPDYMVPPYYVQMDKLPLTPNGKVDRNALPEPDKAAQASVKYVAPTNEIEAKLLDIFQQVLNVQGIGTHHDFFELGGHSLLVMRLVLRIQETFNVGISVRDVFSHSLTESLSRLIGSKVQTSDLSPGLLPIQKTDPDTVIFPLSYAQQRLWFLDQLNPGSSNYNMVGAYKLTGEINSARLEAVFNEIARRHAILRTTFGVREGVPYQHVNAEPRIGFHCIEIPAEQEVSTLIQEEARVGFDLTHGPLLRVLLMRKEGHQSEHVLVVNMHHIISDGWSLNVLVREIGELWKLSGEPEGDFSQFQQPVLQYGDYSIWQRDLFETGYLNEQMVYWKQHLGGHKGVLELPTDKTRSTSGVGRGAEVPIRIAESELTMLKQLAQANSCTLYMVLLAAYAVVIQRYSGEDDIVIGTAVANRSRSELEGLIGFFVNTLALRIDLSEELQLSEYLERVKKVVLNGFSNGDVPFDVVLDEVNPPRLPGIHPLFQTMFILQTASPTTISLQGLEITPVHMPLDESKFDLFLNLEEVRGELVGHLEFNEDLFHGEQIRKLGEYLTSLLDAWVKNADGKLSELKASIQAGRQAKPVLSPQDLRGLLNKLTDGRSG